jgi:hypothetical protein
MLLLWKKSNIEDQMVVKIVNLLPGVLGIALAALLLYDGALSYFLPRDQSILSLAAVKEIVGFVLIVFGAPYFLRAKEN